MRLKDKFPETERQFDTLLNKDCTYEQLTVGSRKQVWWRCNKGIDHVWKASPNQRASSGKLRGCSICAGKKVVLSTCLATTHPQIAAEWDTINNKPLFVENITAGSSRVVWWRCPKGSNHRWQASPKQRTQKNNTCPVCKSLGYLLPKFTSEWHPTKNGKVSPFDLSASSHKRVWWKCPKGPDHVWEASINSRTSNKSGCPICSGYKVLKSNCLATTHPNLASQWFYEKNGNLTPADVHAGSTKKVWWKCNIEDDHIWESQIKSCAQLKLGCPYCTGRRTSKSNSLGTRKPHLIGIWHPEKNHRLSPFDVTPYSSKVVWWKCPEGIDHEWQTSVANIVNGSACPVCLNRKITETNNLSRLYPDLIHEWDFEQNNPLDPSKLSPGSKLKVWWKCKRYQEHIWFASIHDRTGKESGCPFCATQFNVSELNMFELIKQLFPNEKMFYRVKPTWLQRMELDVFLPKIKIGFEYQGQQHFRPIHIFGGKEAYLKQVERDKLKKQLCDRGKVTLIYIYFDEKLNRDLILGKLTDAGIVI